MHGFIQLIVGIGSFILVGLFLAGESSPLRAAGIAFALWLVLAIPAAFLCELGLRIGSAGGMWLVRLFKLDWK